MFQQCLTYQKLIFQMKMMKNFLQIRNQFSSLNLNITTNEFRRNSEKIVTINATDMSVPCIFHFCLPSVERVKHLSTRARLAMEYACYGRICGIDSNYLGRISKVTRYESKGLPIVHHYKYVSELPVNHRFAMKKFHGVLRYLRRDNVISVKQIVEPSPLNMEAMAGVHTQDYLHKFFNGLTSPDEQRKTGFKWTPGLLQRCQYETGGTLLASQLSLQKGLACSTGGGTHHAFPSYGSGYCLVNDLAIAATQLIDQGLAKKILIVDLDVHQGDGTAFIFENNPDVFTLSMHCLSNFPLKKQKSDLDIELENFLEDSAYLTILNEHLPHILTTFRPDIVLYDAGVDPHVKDELGKLNLSDQGLFDRDYYVLKLLASQGIPCATVIGGGYSTDREQLYIRHTIIHRAATKIWNESLL